MADILIGNVKGPQGIPGETGATGAPGAAGADGAAATINVGTVTTSAYGTTAQVTNSGTESAAVFDFVIPQGKPGEETTRMSGLTLDQITAQSATYPIPAVGESGATIWGKVVKFFNDCKTALASKVNVSDIVNNLTSTVTNKPLSAAQGKALNDANASKIMFVDGSNKTAFNARLVASNVSFSNGVGQVTVSTEGRSLSKNAFAVARAANGSLSVAYVTGDSSNNTITVGLTNTAYTGTVLFLILYFLG